MSGGFDELAVGQLDVLVDEDMLPGHQHVVEDVLRKALIEMRVRVIQQGKEPGQGLAYLDDGTMIVVEGGVAAEDGGVVATEA